MALKAVIFDLDDTLYDYTSANEAAMDMMTKLAAGRFNMPAEVFLQTYRMEDRRLKRELPGTAANHNRLIIIQRMLERLRLPSIVEPLDLYDAYWGTLLHVIKPRPGVVEFLQELRANNIRCAICTDLTAHIQHRKLEVLGLAPYFDCIVTSEEVGADKPDPRMFRMCLKKLVVSPKEAIYIGDNFDRDIRGAHAAGIPPVWLNAKMSPRPFVGFEFKEIRSLEQI